ncbi:MAG: hypothetical protein RL326_639, partial [Pseudomonadota bacterium]
TARDERNTDQIDIELLWDLLHSLIVYVNGGRYLWRNKGRERREGEWSRSEILSEYPSFVAIQRPFR